MHEAHALRLGLGLCLNFHLLDGLANLRDFSLGGACLTLALRFLRRSAVRESWRK